MPNPRDPLFLGLAVSAVMLGAGFGLFYLSQGKAGFDEEVALTTDFGTITGLRKGSLVQVAGVVIGRVSSIDFYEAIYDCDPLNEDLGRAGAGRRDDCDPQLFCSPEGNCSKLERWAAQGAEHTQCITDADCGVESVCVTKRFRRRYPRAYWAGEDDVCARFTKSHNRVRVTMQVAADKLPLVCEDSRAKVSSNTMLGDQLIEISRGSGRPIEPGGRVQSLPSFFEDLDNLRDRVEVMSEKADKGLAAISGVFGDMNDERVIAEMKDAIASLNEVTTDVVEARGSIGGLFSDAPRADLDAALAATNGTAIEVDQFLGKANARLGQIDKELQPKIDDARQTMADMRGKLTKIRDPNATGRAARLLYDESGEKLGEVQGKIREVARATADVDAGKGGWGALVNGNSMWDETLKFFGVLGRPDGLRNLVREGLRQTERRQR